MMIFSGKDKHQQTHNELSLLREENETLKKVIEQMKIDMETIVDKVKETLT